jgi:hypothetical protein
VFNNLSSRIRTGRFPFGPSALLILAGAMSCGGGASSGGPATGGGGSSGPGSGGAAPGAGGGGGTTGAGGNMGAGGSTGAAGGSGGGGGRAGTGGSAGATGAGGGGGLAGAGGSAGMTGAGGAGTGGAGAQGPAVAFPGAVGVGKVATGGRGLPVYHVTNLDDSGTGSFRDAVSQSNRFVVFDVGGYVNLATPVSAKSNLTIAGQTAPGDGIGIMGREVSFSGASNVICRYVRFRQGDLDPDSTKSGINLLNTSKMIFDHVSIEFAQWNNIDAVGASNITVQHSISANPIGQQFAAHTETGPYTWYRNLFANAHNRCPLAKANTQYVDNVIYNYQAGYTAGNTAGLFSHDMVHNYFISGPRTTSAGNYFYQMDTQQVFIDGNFADTNNDGVLNGSMTSYPGATTHLTAPFSPDTASLATTSAAATFAAVVADAGASLHRDQVDALVIADVMSLGKSGDLWTHQTATGLANSGYGTLAGGTPPLDTDKDGMPDAWEIKYGLNPNSAADATGDFDHTGYTNIEKYVNSIVDHIYP